MGLTFRVLAASAAVLLLGAQTGRADDVRDELREMQEALEQLQDRVRAQEERIAEQDRALEAQGHTRTEARLAPVGTKSALSSFLAETEFSGFVAGSYTWNTASGDNRAIVGQNSALFLHPDSNTFALDQVWLTMEKPVSERSRAGFHTDLVFGKTASLLNGASGTNGGFGNDGFEVFTAYVSYLAPIGNGIQIDLGELGTLLGGEVVQANGNFNITRGLVWGLQPVTHTGVIASTEVAGLSLKAGFVNDIFSDTNQDGDNGKAFTGGISMGDDMYSVGLSMIYGTDGVPGTDITGGILDVLATWDPNARLSIWYNFDYAWTDVGGGFDTNIYGQALAARYALGDRTGISLRGEYVAVESLPDAWSITGTLDHSLADALKLRAEVRYDDTDAGRVFPEANGTGFNNAAITLLGEVLYEF